MRVKGKDTTVRLFEPVGFEADAETMERLGRLDQGLALFREQNWEAAAAVFDRLAAEEPERALYKLYMDRIAHFREEPPGPDWDGVYTHKEK